MEYSYTMSDGETNIFFIHMLSLLDEKMYTSPFLRENANVTAIKKNICTFLIENCEHDIETDYIDIDQEQSQKIIYCTKCMMTL